jgi:hypothetical protein
VSQGDDTCDDAPYTLRIRRRAATDIENAALRPRGLAGIEIAEEWLAGLSAAISGIFEHPRQFPIVPEADQFTGEVRHLLYRRRS